MTSSLRPRIVLTTFVLVAAIPLLMRSTEPTNEPLFSPQFTDSNFFLTALTAASTTPQKICTGGLIIPHHLLAKDKIATAVASLKNTQYKKLIMLSPDHFTVGQTKISVANKDFLTATGKLKTNTKLVSELQKIPGVSTADFFYREHGIGGLLPFFKATQPNVEVIALTLRSDARQKDLDPLVAALSKAAKDKDTLVVGSIDFSHYLPRAIADQKDQETKAVLEAGDPSKVFSLNQPDHLDSRPVLYVVWSVQKAVGSSLNIADGANSQDYTKDVVDSTTSYFVIYFNRSPLSCGREL